MALVSNKFLGALCVKLGFHKHLRINSPSLIKMIQDYVLEIQEAELESEGARDYWTMTTANPPKVRKPLGKTPVHTNSNDSVFPTRLKRI